MPASDKLALGLLGLSSPPTSPAVWSSIQDQAREVLDAKDPRRDGTHECPDCKNGVFGAAGRCPDCGRTLFPIEEVKG